MKSGSEYIFVCVLPQHHLRDSVMTLQIVTLLCNILLQKHIITYFSSLFSVPPGFGFYE
jgi:hypothetical protein